MIFKQLSSANLAKQNRNISGLLKRLQNGQYLDISYLFYYLIVLFCKQDAM